jgi:ParB family transcriptional regulator, chromosome partitioning protein
MSSGGSKGRRKFTVDSLFQDTSPRAAGVRDLMDAKEIDIARITADPDQPRQSFDEASLEELAASIRQEGVLQPIAVRYDETSDRYIVLHGERRWRASQIAGLTSIPAVVRDVPEDRRLIQQLMENVVREDLNAVDRAAALRLLKRQMDNAPWERVAEAVGIRRSRLFQLLSTEKLIETVQSRIRTGELSEKQTRPLQGLSPMAQETLAEMMIDGLPEKDARSISRRLRNDESYLNFEPGELREHLDAMRDESDESDTSEASSQRSPQERLAVAIAGTSEAGADDISQEISRLGIQLGKVIAGERSAALSPKQLRSLKTLIDLALAHQNGR